MFAHTRTHAHTHTRTHTTMFFLFTRLSGLCTVCANQRREWKKDILSQFTRPTKPCWMNADGSKWETNAWEIAKVFMGPGQHASRSNAAATDPIGLLQLVLNCQLFNSCISSRQPFEDVSGCIFILSHISADII